MTTKKRHRIARAGPQPKRADERFLAGLELHRAGRLDAALAIYDEILALHPGHFDSLHLSGLIAYQTGRFDLAARRIGEAVRVNPGFAAARCNLGNALIALGRPAEALACYDAALARCPDLAEAHGNRGYALNELGRPEEALASCDAALALSPRDARTHNNRGNALLSLRRADEALAAYESALALEPTLVVALENRGEVLTQLGRPIEALASCDAALALCPGDVLARVGRGNALLALGRSEEALRDYDRALELSPAFAKAHNNRGNALLSLRRAEEAMASYGAALALDPADARARNNRGNALLALGRLDEALADYDAALAVDPDSPDALNNRGAVLAELKRLDDAAASYGRALALAPNEDFLLGSYLFAEMMRCEWSSLERRAEDLVAAISIGRRVTTPFPVLGLVDSPEIQMAASRVYAEARHPENRSLGPIAARPAEERIRVGYYSADFHEHATTHLMAELFEAHDAGKLQLFGFSFGPDRTDAMRARVSCAFGGLIDVRRRSDLEVAALSRELGIDIAVDLKGYTKDARPGIFAARCAPIQVSYLGYPGTLAADYMDYVVADGTVIPQEEKRFYTEKIVCLPHCYQVNDGTRRISDRDFTRAELGLPGSGFVYCCFNNNYKIQPRVFAAWMRILRAVPGSVLWLLEDNAAAARNLRRAAEARGVDGARLVFAARLAPDEHLARHRLADLFLDTLPYNAHTTASDALRVGLPVLTRIGGSFAGRVAASLLRAVGLPELIVATGEEYEATAIELAGDRARLLTLKEKLLSNCTTSPLFDGRLFARHLEAAFEAMHARHLQGLPPDHFEVRP